MHAACLPTHVLYGLVAESSRRSIWEYGNGHPSGGAPLLRVDGLIDEHHVRYGRACAFLPHVDYTRRLGLLIDILGQHFEIHF